MPIIVNVFCLFPQLAHKIFSCSSVLLVWKAVRSDMKEQIEEQGKQEFFIYHVSFFIPGSLDFWGKLVHSWAEEDSDISFHCSWNQVQFFTLSVSYLVRDNPFYLLFIIYLLFIYLFDFSSICSLSVRYGFLDIYVTCPRQY